MGISLANLLLISASRFYPVAVVAVLGVGTCGEDALWLQFCVGKGTFRGEKSAFRPGMLLSPCFHPLFILAQRGNE